MPDREPDEPTPTMSEANRRAPPKRWVHFWFSTYGTWLRADERGFRDPGHRVHSSGNYRRLPPPEEHAGLRRWVKKHMRAEPVRFGVEERERACTLLVQALETRGVELLALAVSRDHVHGLGRFEIGYERRVIGNAKRACSHAMRDQHPGTMWGKKCGLKNMHSQQQQRATYFYIARHAHEGAIVWTFRNRAIDGEPSPS